MNAILIAAITAIAWMVLGLIVLIVPLAVISRRNRPAKPRRYSGRHERGGPYYGSETGRGDDGRDQSRDDWGGGNWGGSDQGGTWGSGTWGGSGDWGGGGGDGGDGGGGSD